MNPADGGGGQTDAGSPDAGSPDAGTPDSGPPECDAGFHRCGAACVADDAVESCGTSCSPCAVPANATATCDGSACGYTCAAGYADCDGDASNGCEADLSEAATCGACGVSCDSSETCEPSSAGHVCDPICDEGLTLCGETCVDLTSDAEHCNACDAACPGSSGGTAVCSASSCGLECDATHHLCGDACAANDSVDSCGDSCSPCPEPPTNAVATCDGASCGVECAAGFADCDGDMTNGCELTLADPAGRVLFCDGFEGGIASWTAEANWFADGTAHAGTTSLRGWWANDFATGCGITRTATLPATIDLTGAVTATLEYQHRGVVAELDYLRVVVSTDGVEWTIVDEAPQAGDWGLRTVDLSAYAGSATLQIAFTWHNECGDSSGVDWRIDSVAVHVTR